MDFPRLVYTSPGKHECNGGTYDYELVNDVSEYEAALKAGFYYSVPEALEKKPAKKEEKIEPDTITPLREKAEALGIAVDKRWGEPKLKAEIEKAEGAKDAVRE